MIPPKTDLMVFFSNIGLKNFERGCDVLGFGSLICVINAGKTRIRYKKCLNFSSGLYRTISARQSQPIIIDGVSLI